MIVVYSVTTGGNTLVNIQFTLDSFKKFAEPVYLQVFLKSFQMGLITVGFCFFIGYKNFMRREMDRLYRRR